MKLILQFLKPHWKLTVLTVLLAVIDVGGSLFIPTLAAHLLNQGTSGVAFEELLTTGLQMGAVSLFSSICAILGGYACATLAARVGKDMRVALYEKSLKLSVYDFRQFGTASITTRTVSDITTIQFALTSFIQMVLPVPLVCIIALALSFQLNSTLGTILLILTALVFILALGIMRSASPLFKKLQKLLDRMTTILLENITGVRVVRAFNNEEREQNRMSDAFSNYAETSIKANRRFANLDGLSYFFINLFVVIVYWLSGGYISLGNLQIGDITAVIQYAMMVMFFLMMAQMVILTMPRALECCERIRAVLEHSPEIRDLVEQDDQKTLPNQDEVLAFRNVSFRFADAEENTLSHLNFSFEHVSFGYDPKKILMKDISFSAKPGQKIAVVGSTGAGKTTLVNLLMRFYEINGGKISIDGVDTSKMTRKGLRQNFGMVLQDTWLFGGTIAENIAYSKPDATREEIVAAAKAAKVDYFIRTMPQGYDTMLDNDAANLSAGQRQLLTIARVFLCNPPILILDEATSSVDTRTEVEIGKAMKALMSGRTSFVIAHRLSTIRDADMILYMEHGNIIEQGNHQELLAKKGAYASLYYSQFE